ncbi:hypothetical protein GALMADRAFT_256368 [Galerina marginata CBS 339.88]|uniref:Uncharacterized protein n=1 Tax=Galerina marginata (strain CBS 339.88) TaxID=685588 RepID=A0A067SN65_GALM3|nr:hypothetical protein GALMADRAFT_256368 [Galerina marginata CBS 339.88]
MKRGSRLNITFYQVNLEIPRSDTNIRNFTIHDPKLVPISSKYDAIGVKLAGVENAAF